MPEPLNGQHLIVIVDMIPTSGLLHADANGRIYTELYSGSLIVSNERSTEPPLQEDN